MATAQRSVDPLSEKPWTVAEAADFFRVSVSQARRMFQEEAGIIEMGKSERRDGKRDYVTILIPKSVVRRVYQRLTKGS